MPKKPTAKSDPANNPKDPVMDVSHPENAQANATSRPIIITRKPIVQDPMVRADEQLAPVPGPPALTAKPSSLRKFLTPKKSAGNEAASEMESPVPSDDTEKLTVEQKIADAKVKVEEADASTIEEEKPEELKIVDNSGEVKNPDDSETTSKEKTPKEEPTKPAVTGLPAAVKEMIEPEDVHISGEITAEETPVDDMTQTEARPATGKKVIPVTGSMPAKKTTPAKKTDGLKDINDAPSEESAKALENAIKEDSSKDTDDEANAAENKDVQANADETKTDEADNPNKEQKSGGLVDELAKQAADKKSKDKEKKELSAKQQKINKLVEDKTYFLPIGEVTRKRKNRNSLVVFLLLLVLLAGAYAVVDAGFVEAPIELPIDLIKN